jgi:UDP-N-acetylglucosamine--N-acetylmuramyl-(pentapeptide) pyrophosphoryl-undecaprenol N-acetylglucosamine transferase
LELATITSKTFFGYFIVLKQCIFSFIVSLYYLIKYRPNTIITTGGVTAIPACCAAFLLRIPITIYCLDALPGKAIRAIAPMAQNIMVCFTKAQRFFKKSTITDFPIKYNYLDKKLSQKDALTHLNRDTTKKTIVILGGSQGSLFLNGCIKKIITDTLIDATTLNIIHQTGAADTTGWNEFYTEHSVSAYVFSYQSDLAHIYASADVIVCRAGAGTLFEAQFFNKKCIVIPLIAPTTDHQLTNAYAIAHDYPDNFHVLLQKDVEQNITLLATTIQMFL